MGQTPLFTALLINLILDQANRPGKNRLHPAHEYYAETTTQMFSYTEIHLAVYDVDFEWKLQQSVC